MLSTTVPVKFVSMYVNDLSHSFNKTDGKDKEFFPVFHMSNLTNHQQSQKSFDKLVEESMAIAYKYVVVTNGTPFKVHVKDRSNIVKTFQPNGIQPTNVVTIFTINCVKNPYCNASSISESTDNYCQVLLDKYKQYNDDKLDELRLVYTAVLEHGRNMTDVGYTPTVSQPVTQGPIAYGTKVNLTLREYIYVVTKVEISVDMLKANLSVYLTNKDTVVSIKPLMEVDEHPSLTDDNPLTKTQEHSSNNMFSVVLVDNSKHFTSRYMYMFSEIIEVKPILDSTRKDGLYLFYKIDGSPNQLFLDSLEIDKSNFLYKTKETAISGGDISANYKRQAQEMEHEFKTKEMQHKFKEHEFKEKELELATKLQEAKADLEKRRIEFNDTINRTKASEAENDWMYKEKKLRAQDFYDDRSYKRSETMEMVKTGASIVTTMVAIFLLARKV